jgi:hypothetical protein
MDLRSQGYPPESGMESMVCFQRAPTESYHFSRCGAEAGHFFPPPRRGYYQEKSGGPAITDASDAMKKIQTCCSIAEFHRWRRENSRMMIGLVGHQK